MRHWAVPHSRRSERAWSGVIIKRTLYCILVSPRITTAGMSRPGHEPFPAIRAICHLARYACWIYHKPLGHKPPHRMLDMFFAFYIRSSCFYKLWQNIRVNAYRTWKSLGIGFVMRLNTTVPVRVFVFVLSKAALNIMEFLCAEGERIRLWRDAKTELLLRFTCYLFLLGCKLYSDKSISGCICFELRPPTWDNGSVSGERINKHLEL